MIALVFGILLLVVPFCLVFCHEDKAEGFVRVLIGLAIFHIFTALFLQFLGLFTYPMVLAYVICADILSVFVFLRHRKPFSFSKARLLFKKNLKTNWIVAATFLIVFFELVSVHYFYTGIVIGENGVTAVTQTAYQYPYFSDEYAGIAFSEYSIRTHTLPLVNPLYGDMPASNLLVGFFSVTAELFLLLNVSPLVGYVPFAIVSGMLLCILGYVFLRNRKVDVFSACCFVMAVPLIINSGNLPGIWSLLPFIGGFILFMAGLIVSTISDSKKTLLSFSLIFPLAAFFVSLVLYPPMIVFVAPALLFMILDRKLIKDRNHFSLVVKAIVAAAIITLDILVLTGGYSLVLRDNLIGGIPSFPIWIVAPWFMLPFAALGAWVCLKDKMYVFMAPIIVGLAYWIAYAFTTAVFIIDYPRIVTMTSFLVLLLAAFGLNFLVKKIPRDIYLNIHLKWGVVLQIAVVFVFIVIASSYPSESWADLVLHGTSPQQFGKIYPPASPVTFYLTAGDLKLFSGIEGARFISPPWKGLVIGAATHNYPLDSKASTLTVSIYDYQEFMDLGCVDKDSVAAQFSLQYVYSTPFSCSDFSLVGSTTEGLYLYKYSGYN